MRRLIFGLILGQFCLLADPFPFQCIVQAAGYPALRANGVAELLSDILIICSGGTAGNTQEYDIDVSLSVPVTSANPSAQWCNRGSAQEAC